MSWPIHSGRRRTHNGHTALGTVVACLVGAGWLPLLGRADTYDIGVNLYTDANCLFWSNEFLLLDGGCYANKWAPNSTKGFRMNIVYFNSPQRIDMREYTDDCYNLAMPKRTLITGSDRCNPFLGSMFAQFDIRFRSSTCKGAKCSSLAVAVQTFFTQAFCAGPAFSIFRYPVQGECLRAKNGTQDLSVNGDDTNISLVDYGGSDECKATPGVRQRTYEITNQYCYPLYSSAAPRSFSWRVERSIPYASASGAYRPGAPCLSSLLILAAFLAGFRDARGAAAVKWHRDETTHVPRKSWAAPWLNKLRGR